MKKIQFILILIISIIISFSCEETTSPIDDKKQIDCQTIPNWALPSTYSNLVYYPLFEIVAISNDLNNFIYEWAGNYFYYSQRKNIKKPLNINKIINGEIKYDGTIAVLPCPYDNNKFLLIIDGLNEQNATRTHWYLYEPDTEKSTKITPSDFRENGLDETTYSWLPSPFTWLNSSTEGNDFLQTRYGTYHLQNEVYVEKVDDGSYYNSVSPDGKFKWSGNILNGVKIDSFDNYSITGKSILWSKDSRYFASIRITGSSDLITTYVLDKIDIEKTLTSGRVFVEKTINLRSLYCVYRVGLYAQYLNENKVLVSMSANEKDKGILYEVDLNTGQRTALVSD